MDVTTVTTLIGSLGFPIVACIYMAYINNEQNKRHETESHEMVSAINELKIAITTLTEKMNKDA